MVDEALEAVVPVAGNRTIAADRIGTTAVMRISVVATAVIGLASAFAPGLTGLLVLRFALGVALASTAAGQTLFGLVGARVDDLVSWVGALFGGSP